MSESITDRITTFDIETTLVETRDFENLTSLLSYGPHKSVFFCNVHMLMLAQEDPALANAMNNADIVFADGVPVAWLQSRVSGKDAIVIRGYEMMLAICQHAATNGEKVGFMGSTQNVMNKLISNLEEKFEGLPVAFQYCPPFMQGELTSTEAELKAIKDSGIKWLFIGLGCPKQEKWIAQYKDELDCNILGVRAAFDWLLGC
jgi:N-acetylglucosaminyldiphosphoundecaprenol N-acetyl-beta-D-mannosaminyltransferase